MARCSQKNSVEQHDYRFNKIITVLLNNKKGPFFKKIVLLNILQVKIR